MVRSCFETPKFLEADFAFVSEKELDEGSLAWRPLDSERQAGAAVPHFDRRSYSSTAKRTNSGKKGPCSPTEESARRSIRHLFQLYTNETTT